MRTYPDKDDMKDLADLKAPAWMVELLKSNPAYPHWGPHEDYMIVKEGAGWHAPIFYNS